MLTTCKKHSHSQQRQHQIHYNFLINLNIIILSRQLKIDTINNIDNTYSQRTSNQSKISETTLKWSGLDQIEEE